MSESKATFAADEEMADAIGELLSLGHDYDADRHAEWKARRADLLARFAALRERAERAEAMAVEWASECASISVEFDLPPSVRPANGEIRRLRESVCIAHDRATAAERERDEARAALQAISCCGDADTMKLIAEDATRAFAAREVTRG